MLLETKYYKYPDGMELVAYFYDALFFWNTENISEIISGFSKKVGVAVAEGIKCSFASQFTPDEEEYFGQSGVAISIDYPILDNDTVITMTDEQFLNVLEINIDHYSDQFTPEKMKEIHHSFDDVSKALLND